MWSCTSYRINAQDLHVFYNIQTEQVIYTYKGDTLTNPRAKKNGNIIVHVTEFNDYIYDIEIETSAKEIPVPQISKSPLVGILSKEKKTFLENTSGKSLFLPEPRTETNNALQNVQSIAIDVPSGFVEASEEEKLENLRTNFIAELRQLNTIEKNIIIQQKRIDNILQRDKVRQIAATNISTIKSNPKIKPSRIKELVKTVRTKDF